MKKIRIGSGAGYGGDRLDPALLLMRHASLNYIGFECLAERTIALAQREKLRDPSRGYNSLLEYRMKAVLPLARAGGIKVLTNMGAANPEAALDRVVSLAREQGLTGMRMAAVLGDDVRGLVLQNPHLIQLENGRPIGELADRILSANAYLGCEPLVEALERGAEVVITGRVADPALFLAPMIYEFGWGPKEWDLLGKGTLVGHLLECAGQVCGGYFSDPLRKPVPEPWNLGFPFVEVDATGEGFISKAPDTGGIVTPATCTEQLLYEIHNPSAYLTPDCTADFGNVHFAETGPDQVAFSGASGKPPTDTYKVSVGYRNGYLGEGQISYGGSGCVARARMAGETIRRRLQALGIEAEDLRLDLIGLNAINPLPAGHADPPEVRLRVAARTPSQDQAEALAGEVEALYTNGPAGGGGASKKVEELVSVVSVLLPKSEVTPTVIHQKA